MIIIVEGQDRCGKDSVIDFIKAKYFSSAVFHEVKYTKINSIYGWNGYKEYKELLYRDAMRLVMTAAINNINLILNRSWISEYVYASLYRGYEPKHLFIQENDYFTDGILDNVFLIVLTDKEDNLVKREDGNSLTTNSGLRYFKAEVDKFKEAFDMTTIRKVNKLFLDVSKLDNVEQVKQTIDLFLPKIYTLYDGVVIK